jgi:hypothetical protein
MSLSVGFIAHLSASLAPDSSQFNNDIEPSMAWLASVPEAKSSPEVAELIHLAYLEMA